MWKISKQFDFCYGHRVYTQELEEEFSLTTECKCRHLHGHQGTVLVELGSTELNKQGMVCDFLNLNWFKKFLDDVVDHKFLVCDRDPMKTVMYHHEECNFIHNNEYGYSYIDTSKYESPSSEKEYYDSFVIVPFVPTSENISQWFFNIAKNKMEHFSNVWVTSVTLFETPKSKSVYGN